jgi:hypothetical protein
MRCRAPQEQWFDIPIVCKRFDEPLKDLGLTPFGIARA